jgi:type VI secretion system ImpM family protein
MDELQLQVSLFGKHPSSSEYLHVGQSSNFTNSIAKWIQEGYEALLQSRTSYTSDNTSHFYFLDTQDDSFVCGSVKLSRDAKNREYPLVIFTQVHSYSSFSNSYEPMQYSQEIWKEILEIFKRESDLQELKSMLAKLSTIRPSDLDYKASQAEMLKVHKDVEDKSFTAFVDSLEIDWEDLHLKVPSLASSTFVNEQFCKTKLFYRPLQIDDFISIMR